MKRGPSGNRQSLSANEDDDWTCGICMKTYSNDAKKKTGASWIQCSFCRVPYHGNCQKQSTDEDAYMRDTCCEAERQNSGVTVITATEVRFLLYCQITFPVAILPYLVPCIIFYLFFSLVCLCYVKFVYFMSLKYCRF